MEAEILFVSNSPGSGVKSIDMQKIAVSFLRQMGFFDRK